MSKYIRNSILVLFTISALVIAYNVHQLEQRPPKITYSDFIDHLQKDDLKEVEIKGNEIRGTDNLNQPFYTVVPDIAHLIPRLEEKKIRICDFWGPLF